VRRFTASESAISRPVRKNKSNPILVVGCEIGIAQLIVFDLVEKGFAVRVANVDRKEAIRLRLGFWSNYLD